MPSMQDVALGIRNKRLQLSIVQPDHNRVAADIFLNVLAYDLIFQI